MSLVLAIDPGPTQSAYVLWDGKKILYHGKDDNDKILDVIGCYGWQRTHRSCRLRADCIIRHGCGCRGIRDLCLDWSLRQHAERHGNGLQ